MAHGCAGTARRGARHVSSHVEAARALDVHEEGVRALDQALELVEASLVGGRRVEKITGLQSQQNGGVGNGQRREVPVAGRHGQGRTMARERKEVDCWLSIFAILGAR